MGTIADEYGALRQAQVAISQSEIGAGVLAMVCNVGITRRFIDGTFLWNTRDKTADDGLGRVGWPGDTGNANELIPSTQPAGYLSWLSRRGDYWVPSLDQLLERNRVRFDCLTAGRTENEQQAAAA